MATLTREEILKLLAPQFEMETEKFGTIKVKRLSVGDISEIVKRLHDFNNRTGREIALAAISIISKADESKIDVSQLSEPELTELADQYLASTSIITDNEGNPIVSVKREEGESSTDYLGRVIAAEIKNFHDSMVKVVDRSGILKASKQIGALESIVDKSSALSAFKGIHAATDTLRSALNDVERFKMFETPAMQTIRDLQKQRELYDSVVPSYVRDAQKMQNMMQDYAAPLWQDETSNSSAVFRAQPIPRIKVEDFQLPPNPIHETNEKLSDLNQRMDAFTETLAEHLEASAVALQEVASEIKTGSKGTSKQNWWAIGIAALSLVVAIAGFFKDSFKSPPSDAKQPSTATIPATIVPAPVRPATAVKPAVPVKPIAPVKQVPVPK